MEYKQEIINKLNTLNLGLEGYGACHQIEYYTIEKGSGIKGYIFGQNMDSIRYISYDPDFSWDLHMLLYEWQSETSENNKWNKATFKLYNNGNIEVKIWWDEDFQKQLYPNG
ncbi:hypothetical protein [Runella limosa]|uniref:hypothetical protein n=1 Tax=Runella limosa TaxID=370978 RepID=UPI00040A8F43|nr:hypothetical protein [Runella limosa]